MANAARRVDPELVFRKLSDDFLGGADIRREQISATVSISASAATAVLPQNPNRIGWFISNKDGANTVDVDWSPDVSSSQGIPLSPGSTLDSKFREDGSTVHDALLGLARVGACTVYRRAWEIY